MNERFSLFSIHRNALFNVFCSCDTDKYFFHIRVLVHCAVSTSPGCVERMFVKHKPNLISFSVNFVLKTACIKTPQLQTLALSFFSDVLIFVLFFFVQATSFTERDAFLVAFQVL